MLYPNATVGIASELQAAFLDLSRAQIFECQAYYEDHRAEIEKLALPQIEQAEK